MHLGGRRGIPSEKPKKDEQRLHAQISILLATFFCTTMSIVVELRVNGDFALLITIVSD